MNERVGLNDDPCLIGKSGCSIGVSTAEVEHVAPGTEVTGWRAEKLKTQRIIYTFKHN
jgi:hypothetical protein